MIPTEEALAALAAVECEQDGDGSPFGWWEPYTPAGAPQPAPDATRGPKAALRAARGRLASFLTSWRTK